MKKWEDRLNQIDLILNAWMLETGESQTTPSACIDLLVDKGIYSSTLKNKQLAFRNDLRKALDKNERESGVSYTTDHLVYVMDNGNWFINKRI